MRPKAMRRFAWIWYLGFLAWLVDAFVSMRLRNQQHAVLALMLALVFLAAGVFYSQQKR